MSRYISPEMTKFCYDEHQIYILETTEDMVKLMADFLSNCTINCSRFNQLIKYNVFDLFNNLVALTQIAQVIDVNFNIN